MYSTVYVPDAPEGINQSAADFWRYVHEATPIGDHERTILERICRALTLVDEMEAQLRRDGDFTIAGAHGSTVAHPLLAAIRLQLGLIDSMYKTLKLHDIVNEVSDAKDTVAVDPQVIAMIERAKSRKGK